MGDPEKSESAKVREELQLMTDSGFMSFRIRSAGRLLTYQEAPVEVKMQAKAFLETIVEDRNQHVDLRLYAAAQVLRKHDSPTDLTSEQKAERTEAWRWYEIWDLKRCIVRATGQMPPSDFASDLLSPDYLPPPGDDWPPVNVQRSWFTVIGHE